MANTDQYYTPAEECAKEKELVLWKTEDPVPPWNWRTQYFANKYY